MAGTNDSQPTEIVDLTAEELDAAAKAEARLAALDPDDGGGVEDGDGGNTGDREEDSQAVDESGVATPTPEKKPAADDANSNPTPDEISVPDAYVRAAIHQGLSEEDVKSLLATNPETGMKTLENLYKATNSATQEFARLGRLKQTVPTSAPAQPAAPTAQAKSKIDFAALDERYGADDPLVQAFKNLTQQLESTNTPSPVVPEPRPATTVQQDSQDIAVVKQQIDNFFVSDALKPYSDLYGAGKDRNKLTIEQAMLRDKLLGEADHIMVGAELNGLRMSVDEAMERAHLIVTDSHRASIVRNDILKSVVKRSKSVTLKPKGSTPAAQVGSANTEADVEARVEARLKKLNG